MIFRPGVEVFDWKGVGYQPLVFSESWQVALLNWEPCFDLEKLGEIERHNQTDEVFVLVNGKAVLFTIDAQEILHIEEMQPNVIYNVTRGSWHNLISTRDATWIIVENRDTHLGDTEIRQLNLEEQQLILAGIPGWANNQTN